MYRFYIPAFGITFCTGLLLGATVNAWMFHPAPPISIITDVDPPSIPVVSIEGIRNAALIGSIIGNVRLFAQGTLVTPTASGSFSLTNKKLLTNIVETHIPVGMQFVASKKGKKYYSVTSASAGNLSLANRIYFPSAEAAEKAGYRR